MSRFNLSQSALLLGFLVWGLSSSGPSRAQSPLSGKLYEYIEPTGLGDALEGKVGFAPSPSGDGKEMGDALGEFTDQGGAMRQLEALKSKDGYAGGRVFAGFLIEDSPAMSGDTWLLCGVSKSESQDWDEVRSKMTSYSGTANGTFKNFKRATRAERVRAIARCLAGLPGMPKLKPTRPELKAIYIDPASYQLAEAWLRGMDRNGIQGSSEQYRQAFLCVVSQVARSLPEALGDSVLIRTMVDHSSVPVEKEVRDPIMGGHTTVTERSEVTSQFTVMSVLNEAAARKLYSSDDIDDFSGPWPSTLGTTGMIIDGETGPIAQILRGYSKYLPECRRRAGLFELPPSQVEVGTPARPCGH